MDRWLKINGEIDKERTQIQELDAFQSLGSVGKHLISEAEKNERDVARNALWNLNLPAVENTLLLLQLQYWNKCTIGRAKHSYIFLQYM